MSSSSGSVAHEKPVMAENKTPEPEQPDQPDPGRAAEPARRRRGRKPLTDAEKAASAVGGIVATTPTV